MTDINMRSFFEVRAPNAVRALTVGHAREWLAPFFHGEHSVAEVSRQTGIELRSLSNQVRALHALGLLEQTRVQSRKGRAVAYYRCVAREFFIPAEVMPLELVALGEARYQRVFLEALLAVWNRREDVHRWGFRVFANGPETAFNLATAPEQSWNPLEPTTPPFYTSWMMLELTHEDAKELQQQMHELLCRFQVRSTSGQPKYLTRYGLVRLLES